MWNNKMNLKEGGRNTRQSLGKVEISKPLAEVVSTKQVND